MKNKSACFFVLSLFVCSMFTSCNKESTTECQTIDFSTLFDGQPEKIPLKEWAKSIHFVQLETNDSVLIGNIRATILHKDKILVHHNNLSLFDLSGKFICNIGSKGGGPTEYSGINNAWTDDEGIHIFDIANKIKTYNWNGKWIKTEPIPESNIKEVFPLASGNNIKAGYIQNITGNEPHKIYLFKDSTILAKIPYGKSFQKGEMTMVFYNECYPFHANGRTFFKEMFNDTIFSIDNQYQPVPRWYIELGKYKIAEDARYTLTDPRKSVFDNAATLTPIGKWDNKLFFFARANKQNYLFYYDLKEKKSNSIQISYPENSFAIPEEHSFIPKCMSDDGKYLISYEIQENDENPVIILAEK